MNTQGELFDTELTHKTISSRVIADAAGRRNADVMRGIRKRFNKKLPLQTYYVAENSRKQPHYLLTYEQAFLLLSSYQFINKEKATAILSKHFNKQHTVLVADTRAEFIFGAQIIHNLFSEYTILKQYPVLSKYKIDWYIPELKLAIEFDEKYHIHCTYTDKQRQKEIEIELGCKFIRYSE